MVGYYTADFRAAKPEAATDYLILICLNADLDGEHGRQQAELCYEALRELVLETREFAALVGDIRSDGQRVPGAIEQRLKLIRHKDIKTEEDNKTFLKTLTMQAASAADDSGRVTDAVLLYHLAEEYDTVIAISNRALSEALSVELGQSPLRLEPLKPRAPLPDQTQQQKSKQQSSGGSPSTLSLTAVSDPLTLSKNMYTLYANGSILFTQISSPTREASLTLQNMAAARALLESGNHLRAIQAIEALNLLPLNAQGSIAVVRSYANNFNDLPRVVAGRVGDLLIWAVLALARERERLRGGEWENVVRKDREAELVVAARDLLVFAGLIKYKLAPKVFEVLSRVGQDIGA
jgi:nuclear pore complex protein Nup93